MTTLMGRIFCKLLLNRGDVVLRASWREHLVPALWVGAGDELFALVGCQVGERILYECAAVVEGLAFGEFFVGHLDETILATMNAIFSRYSYHLVSPLFSSIDHGGCEPWDWLRVVSPDGRSLP